MLSSCHVRRSSVRLLALLTALACWTALGQPAAADTSAQTDTDFEENVPVQACAGFDVVSSFTVQREYRVGYPAWEQQRVEFAGAFANATTHASIAYAGRFTRIVDLDAGTVTIGGLWLQLVPASEAPNVAAITRDAADDSSAIIWQDSLRPAAPIEVVAARLAGDLPASPPDVVLAVAPPAVTARLCQLLGG